MPALEMAQETGKLVSWRKKEGDRVAKGETLMEVETDKAVVEVEAQAEGILGGVTANTGDVVPVGRTIAWLLQPGEKPPAATAQAQTGRKMESSPAAQAATPAQVAPAAAAAGPVQVSPKARRLAKEHGSGCQQAPWFGPRRRDRRRRRAHSGEIEKRGACSGSLGARRRHSIGTERDPELDRPADGRTNDAELDDGSAFLRDPRGGRQRPCRGARETGRGHRAKPRREAHLHGPPGGARGARADAASAHERKLGWRSDQDQPRSEDRTRHGRGAMASSSA